jgi:hypothetical protein
VGSFNIPDFCEDVKNFVCAFDEKRLVVFVDSEKSPNRGIVWPAFIGGLGFLWG